MRTRVTRFASGWGIVLIASCAPNAHAITVGVAATAGDRISIHDVVAVSVVIAGLEPGAAPSLGAFDLRLDFAPSVLEPRDVTPGDGLDGGVRGSLDLVDLAQRGALFASSVSFETPELLDARQPASFALFVVRFAAVGTGTSDLVLRGPAGGVAFADAFGLPLDASFTTGRLTVVPEPDARLPLLVGAMVLCRRATRRGRGLQGAQRPRFERARRESPPADVIRLRLLLASLACSVFAPCSALAQVWIDEAVVSHLGVDDTEFVELFGSAGRSLAGLSLIAVEGDLAAAPGSIDTRIDFGAGDVIGRNGAFLVGNPIGLANHYGVVPDRTLDDDAFENSSLTLALVVTASLDGARVSGREVVLDAISLLDGGSGDVSYFGAPVLGPEGLFFPAGAQRIIRGVDTDRADDFTFVPFDLGPLATPTPATGIALVTPIAIPRLQGTGASTPFEGARVMTGGVVVAAFQSASRLGGFFLQDPVGDDDAASSDGVFVALRRPPVSEGDRVEVTGRVREHVGRTQIQDVTSVRVLGRASLPDPVPVTLPERVDGELERYEGMRVEVASPMTVTDAYFLGRYGQLTLSGPDGGGHPGRLFQPTQIARPGPPARGVADENARRTLVLDDGQDENPAGDDPDPVPFSGEAPPAVPRAGDRVESLAGVLDQGRVDGAATPRPGYRLQPTRAPHFTRANPRPALPIARAGAGRLRVASFNVLNYFTTIDHGPNVCGPTGTLDCRGADSAAEFARQREKILPAIASLEADILGLVELENDAGASLADLVRGLNAIEGPGVWAFVDTGIIGSDAIKPGLAYRTAAVSPDGPFAVLDDRVDPRAISTRNRPSLAQTFRERASGELVTVVVNHFKSKGSSCDVARAPGEPVDPDLGDGQGNCNRTRTHLALALRDWVARDPTSSGDPDLLLLGDFNANAYEDPVQALVRAGFVDLVAAFEGDRRHSYVFAGEAGALDHGFASPTLRNQVAMARVVPINADEPALLGYDTEFNPPAYYTPTPWRSSDHDPEIFDLQLCVDRSDLDALLAAMRLVPVDPRRDLDEDGRITVADARRLALRFTRPRGAPCG